MKLLNICTTAIQPPENTKDSNDCLERDFVYCLDCIMDVYSEELEIYRETIIYPSDKCAACSEDCVGLCTEEDCELSGSSEWTETSYECWECTLINSVPDSFCYNQSLDNCMLDEQCSLFIDLNQACIDLAEQE